MTTPKFYKNPARNQPDPPRQFLPLHQELGMEPQLAPNRNLPQGTTAVKKAMTTSNPRTQRPQIIPNVGNNADQSWSSAMDGEIVDDLDQSFDPNQQMVDNNEFYSNQAMEQRGQPNQFVPAYQPPPSPDNISAVISQLEEGAYLLIVGGVAVCSGSMEDMQEQARLMVFGDHEMCDREPISVEEIIILKRLTINVGVFLE